MLAEIAIFSSLYAVLTWVLAPISYQVFQFRFSECLKSLVIRRKHLIWAFVVGNALSNIFSPFIGPWELLWMPFINLIGAGTAWLIGNRMASRIGTILGSMLYALWIAFGVSFMLYSLFNVPFLLTFLYILIPETILIVGFSPMMFRIDQRISEKLN